MLCLYRFWQVWTPPEGFQPLPVRWSLAGTLTAAAYLAAIVYYVYVRVVYTLAMGSTSWCVNMHVHILPMHCLSFYCMHCQLLLALLSSAQQSTKLMHARKFSSPNQPTHQLPAMTHCALLNIVCGPSRYGICILGVECVGFSAVLPYTLMLLRRCTYAGRGGLPTDNGRLKLPRDKRFVVRVLIPCYKARA